MSDYFLRCRILARMRRFLRPILRRPFPDFLVPTSFSGIGNVNAISRVTHLIANEKAVQGSMVRRSMVRMEPAQSEGLCAKVRWVSGVSGPSPRVGLARFLALLC